LVLRNWLSYRSYAIGLFHLPGNELVLNLFHIHLGVVTATLRRRATAQGESDEKAADVFLLGSHIAA
jgi:hypothetical protein